MFLSLSPLLLVSLDKDNEKDNVVYKCLFIIIHGVFVWYYECIKSKDGEVEVKKAKDWKTQKQKKQRKHSRLEGTRMWADLPVQ